MPYVLLGAAIVLEVIATTFLKLSDGFTKPLFSIITMGGYTASFYFLSLCIQQLGVGFTYAVWSAVGIVLIASIGIVVFHEKLDLGGVVGMGLIIAGVIVLNVFSKMSGS
ncbi:MAG: multidrug efflux SMR transporter [Marinicaulis sp.]|nr:multidrug efflux SMR transporter [Marinicaulis sp.]